MVVNSAGVFSAGPIIHSKGVVSSSVMEKVLKINVIGTLNVSKYAANEPKKILINAKKKKMSSIIGLPIKEFTFPTSNNILISKYKETFVEIAEKKPREFKMPVSVVTSSNSTSKTKQILKQKVQVLMKKTNFSETEINRLLDVHYQIMVSIGANFIWK